MDNQSEIFNNDIDRQNDLLDVGHYFDDVPSTRQRNEYAADQIINDFSGNCLFPREPMIDEMNHRIRRSILRQLDMIGLTRRPKTTGSTLANNK